ncbi:MAG: aldo/keto reductase [Verrucomicrobia bacterium]|nr:aldo/keto reductase [Verrucomicrobiota bacterium]
MKSRPLGRTGLTVSEIGFGTWGLGGNVGGSVAYGPTDDRESLRALQAALDCGVTFYDTSDLYGFGHSEKLLGEAFAGKRNRVVIATKAGFVDARGAQDFSTAHIRRALDASLQRLQTDHVDLLQLHNPPMDLLERNPETIAALKALQGEGKIRAWGISVRSPDDGLAAVERFAGPVIQVNFNLADQRARQNGLFDLCAQRGTGCIIRTPLCFGFLTRQAADGADYDPSDHRRRWSPEQRQRWMAAGEAFRAAAGGGGPHTDAQLALRFCLSYAAVSTVIPGMLTVSHVADNAAASALGALSADERRRTEQIYEEQAVFLAEGRPAQDNVRE